MSLCSSACAITMPPTVNQCFVDTRPGGISRLVFAACDVVITDYTDQNQWCPYITAGKIVMTQKLLGEKPKGSASRKRLDSCSPEKTTGFSRSVTFQDHNADDTNFVDFDFWNAIQVDSEKYQFGFLTCDGLFFGFFPDFTTEIDPVIPNNKNEPSFWDGTIMWDGIRIEKPVALPNLVTWYLTNCAP